MNTAQVLKERTEELATKRKELDALGQKIEARTWDDKVDKPAMDALEAEMRALESQIEVLRTKLDVEKRAAANPWTTDTTAPVPAVPAVTLNVIEKRGDKPEDARQRFHFANAIKALQGDQEYKGLVREMHDEATKEAREAGLRDYGKGVMIPSFIQQRLQPGFHKRDMSTTVTDGGYTIQTNVGQLIPYLDPQGVISRLGVQFLPGLIGNVDFPRNDNQVSAVWAAEQAASTESNLTTDRVQMSPNRLTAFSDFSSQLLRQSTINVENLVRERLMNARDRALDVAVLNGGGGTAPLGITGAGGVNVISVAASPTWAKIVAFETEVALDDALNDNAIAYLTTPGVAGILKTIKRDVAGNGFIWEGNNTGGGSINGYRAITSTTCPTGSGGHFMFFGDWSRAIVGQWGGSELMLDPYTGLTTATMRVVLNTWHDVAIEWGKAFAYSSTMHPS